MSDPSPQVDPRSLQSLFTPLPTPTRGGVDDGSIGRREGAQTLAASMSLFDLDECLCSLMEAAVDATTEDGEVPQELRQALVAYCEAFGEKVDNIACYIRWREFEAGNAAAEIERLKRRKVLAERHIDRLKAVLTYFMQTRDLRAMKGRLATISLRKNSQDALILESAFTAPDEFVRVQLVLKLADVREIVARLPENHELRAQLERGAAAHREPDTAAIRSALEAGRTIGGATLRRGTHIRIS